MYTVSQKMNTTQPAKIVEIGQLLLKLSLNNFNCAQFTKIHTSSRPVHKQNADIYSSKILLTNHFLLCFYHHLFVRIAREIREPE